MGMDITLPSDLDLYYAQVAEREYRERLIAHTRAYQWILTTFPPACKVLKSVWEDASYPSVIQAWGVTDCEDEASLLPDHLDQVWLHRTHIDRPVQWLIFTVTVGELKLQIKESSIGSLEKEGSLDYLTSALIHMEYSLERGARELGKVLYSALDTGQLRYFHLHFKDLETIQTDEPYVKEFPIYRTPFISQDRD
jgi:hypothetical protein